MSNDGQNNNDSDFNKKLEEHGVHLGDDNVVSWNDDCSDKPRNWSTFKKAYNVALISWLELLMTGISTAGTSAASSAYTEYGISETLAYFAFVSLYLVGQTLGGIFCSPLSETFGRRTLYIGSAFGFCVFNIIIAAIDSDIAVFFGRFFSGFVAAIPATVAFGNFEDLYDAKSRIWVVYIYTTLGNFGLVLGPIYGAYITERINWRWVFWIAAIASLISAAAAFLLNESRAVSVLDGKVKRINKETGKELKADGADKGFSFKDFIQVSLYRPLFFLVTEPLVTFCAILCSIAYGLIYGSTESLTIVYESFGFSETSSSLSFIALLIGLLLNVIPRIYEFWLFHKFERENRTITPETKIRSFAVACPALAIGLWLFGWTIPPLVNGVPWAISMIGLILIGFSANDFAYILFGYMTDAYGEYAASAVSSLSLSRTLVAAAFPLFTTQMYEGLGSNVATSILAAVATLFAFTPILFLTYGQRMRKNSKFASNESDEDGDGEGSDEEKGGEKGGKKGENGEEESKERDSVARPSDAANPPSQMSSPPLSDRTSRDNLLRGQ